MGAYHSSFVSVRPARENPEKCLDTYVSLHNSTVNNG